MDLTRQGDALDRQARINENTNQEKIERSYGAFERELQNTVENVSNEAFDKVVGAAAINWKEPVANVASLPIDDENGTARQVRDTGKVYRFNGTDWIEIQDYDATAINEVDSRLSAQLADIAVYAREFGVVGDGVTDNSTTLLNTLKYANGREVILPTGTVKISQKVIYDGRVNIKNNGNTTIDFSGGGSFSFASPLSNLPNLSSEIKAGQNLVTFSDHHGLKEGDVFIVYNSTDYSWATYRSYYRDGCMFRVDQVVSDTQLKIFGVSPGNYAFSNVSVFKLTGKGVNLNGLEIIPNPTVNVQVWVDGHQRVNINNCEIKKGASNTCVEIWRSFDVNIDNLKAEVFGGDSYPLVISNSQKVTVSNSPLYSSRHSLALGGRDGDGSVPTRDVLIDHCHLWNRSDGGVGASDIHGNCENITYSDCYMNTGANMAGSNVKYSNCTIVGRNPEIYPDGNCIFGTEVVSGTFEVENCRLITYGDGANFAAGLHLNLRDRKGNVVVRVKGCTLENRGNSTTMRAVILGVGGTDNNNSNKIDVEVDGLKVISNSQFFSFLFFAGLGAVKDLATCIVNNVSGSARSLVASSNSDNNNMPMRLQRQSGYQQITAGVGTSTTVGTAQTFKYRYPKDPIAQVSVGSSTALMYNGSNPLIPGIYRVRAYDIVPFISTGDSAKNWAASKDTNVMWTVSVEDF